MAGDDPPRGKADADLERDPPVGFAVAVEQVKGLEHRKARAHSVVCVVARGLGHAEQRHDRVADVLVDDPVVAPDHVGHEGEVLVHHRDDRLRSEALAQLGEAAYIAEEHRGVGQLPAQLEVFAAHDRVGDRAGHDLVEHLAQVLFCSGVLDGHQRRGEGLEAGRGRQHRNPERQPVAAFCRVVDGGVLQGGTAFEHGADVVRQLRVVVAEKGVERRWGFRVERELQQFGGGCVGIDQRALRAEGERSCFDCVQKQLLQSAGKTGFRSGRGLLLFRGGGRGLGCGRGQSRDAAEGLNHERAAAGLDVHAHGTGGLVEDLGRPEAQRFGPFGGALAAKRGKDHHLRGAAQPQAAECLQPGEFGHFDVEQDDVGLEETDFLKRDFSVFSGVDHLEIRVAFDDFAHEPAHDVGVVDHEHRLGQGMGSWGGGFHRAEVRR